MTCRHISICQLSCLVLDPNAQIGFRGSHKVGLGDVVDNMRGDFATQFIRRKFGFQKPMNI